MRDFEERKAEIFRRSDERIKERKRNRRRILMSCVTVVLFAGVFSLSFAHNAFMAKESSDRLDSWGETVDVKAPSLVYPIDIELKNLDSGKTRNIEGCYDIIRVTGILNSLTERGKGSDQIKSETQRTDTYEITAYEITVTREEESGEEKTNVYILQGDIIIDESTQKEYQLSDDELDELLTVLGLTD